MGFAEKALAFYRQLDWEGPLPEGVEIMIPYREAGILKLMEQFLFRYYSGEKERVFVWGINPGRFGAGVTGITFTDPVNLEQACGIPNQLQKKQELSSRFIYAMIGSYGGVRAFYSDFFLTAVSPLGFIKNGKNINYYDFPELRTMCLPFIVKSMQEQISFGASRRVCVCLGEGKNDRFLRQLNAEHGFFKEIFSLPHPRFIMQYRYRQIDSYIREYLEAFRKARHLAGL